VIFTVPSFQDAKLILEKSFSQGDKWKALMSKYIGTIPLSGDPAEQKISGVPLRTGVSNAMIAKVGAAASDSQSAALTAAAASHFSPVAASCLVIG
jgi:hypothetical protein